jgi:hypothetical protein
MPFDDGLWLSESSQERRKRRRHRLKDIEVSEVSLVDRAANKRKFLVTKREGEMLKTKKRKVNKGSGLIDLDGDTDFGTDPGHLKAAVKKGEAIPAPVKNAVQRALTEATERLMGVVQTVQRAEASSERAPRPLPESIGKEVMAVGALLQGILRSYPSPVESEDDKKDEEKEDTEKSMSSSARKSILETLDAVNKRIIALHRALKQEEDEESDDDEEMDDKKKADDGDEDEEKDADGEKKQDDEEEDEESDDDEKTDTEKSAAVAKELHGLSLLLGGALARVPTAKAVALVEIDVPADTIEKDADGLVLHPAVKKALASGLEDALDALSGSLRNLNRIDTAKSDDVPNGYSLPKSVSAGAAKAGEALLTMGMQHGTIASGEAHDLDASLNAARKATEDAKQDDEEEEDDADKAVADKAKKGKKVEPDMTETIKDAIAAAMAPMNERLEQIESGVKKNAKSVKKALNAKSTGNAVPAGTKVEKSEQDQFDDECVDLNRMTPAKVEQLKKDGLWF